MKKKTCHLAPKVVIDLPFEGRKVKGSRKYRGRERVPKVGSRREETITSQNMLGYYAQGIIYCWRGQRSR